MVGCLICQGLAKAVFQAQVEELEATVEEMLRVVLEEAEEQVEQ
jgi:hypothetical protein